MTPSDLPEQESDFQFGNRALNERGFRCCGKPVGCTMTHEGCAHLRHPWKRAMVFGEPNTPEQEDWGRIPDKHLPLVNLGDALVFLEEIEFAMRHAPIKQHDRTPEEQEAVERYTTYWVWIKDVLRQHGFPMTPEQED